MTDVRVSGLDLEALTTITGSEARGSVVDLEVLVSVSGSEARSAVVALEVLAVNNPSAAGFTGWGIPIF